jgi:hypothetical protein
MLFEKSIENYKSENIKNTDITAKKIKKNLDCENPLISGISAVLSPGIADIAVKKINKRLDFYFWLC